MGSVPRHIGWLLLWPKPTDEERDRASPKLFLFLGGVVAALALLGLLIDRFDPGNLRQLALALVFLLLAGLYALPEARRRAMLVVRAALTLSSVAFFLLIFAENYYDTTPGRFDQFLAVAALAVVPAIFGYNYFRNRRGHNRPRPTASS